MTAKGQGYRENDIPHTVSHRNFYMYFHIINHMEENMIFTSKVRGQCHNANYAFKSQYLASKLLVVES